MDIKSIADRLRATFDPSTSILRMWHDKSIIREFFKAVVEHPEDYWNTIMFESIFYDINLFSEDGGTSYKLTLYELTKTDDGSHKLNEEVFADISIGIHILKK